MTNCSDCKHNTLFDKCELKLDRAKMHCLKFEKQINPIRYNAKCGECKHCDKYVPSSLLVGIIKS